MSAKPTKERILDAAEELMLENSFHSVGLTQILKAVNIPKGSFYHHFASKEEFGVELLKYYSANASRCKKQALLDSELEEDPITRLISFFEGGIASFQASGGKCPCLIAKLATEVVNLSDDMRLVLAKKFDEWVSIYEQVLKMAVNQDLLPGEFDCRRHAQLIHDIWYGALQRAIACKSVKPLRNALAWLKDTLATPTPA